MLKTNLLSGLFQVKEQTKFKIYYFIPDPIVDEHIQALNCNDDAQLFNRLIV